MLFVSRLFTLCFYRLFTLAFVSVIYVVVFLGGLSCFVKFVKGRFEQL
jgi:hypothetical protein